MHTALRETTYGIIERLSGISDFWERSEALQDATSGMSADRRDYIEGAVEDAAGTFEIDWALIHELMIDEPWRRISRRECTRSVYVGRLARICKRVPTDVEPEDAVECILANVFARHGYSMSRRTGDDIYAVQTINRD